MSAIRSLSRITVRIVTMLIIGYGTLDLLRRFNDGFDVCTGPLDRTAHSPPGFETPYQCRLVRFDLSRLPLR